jgi:hypothetical protein
MGFLINLDVIVNRSSITYRIFANENIVISKVRGMITFQDMIANIHNLRDDINYSQGMNAIYSLLHCTNINGELHSLSEFCDLLNDHIAVPNKCKTAVLIPDNNEKMYRIVQGLVLMTSESNI